MSKSKCPVCDWDIEKKGVSVKVGDRVVVVCCDDCAAKVREKPEKFGKGK